MVFVDLACVTLEAAHMASCTGVRIVVYSTPVGYVCSAETTIARRQWLVQLLSRLKIEEMPDLGSDDTFVLQVPVPNKPPLELIDLFQTILPADMKTCVYLTFLVNGEGADHDKTIERTITAHFVTLASLETSAPELAMKGPAIILAHSQRCMPRNPIEFWQAFANGIESTGLCKRIIAGENDLGMVLTEDAAKNLIPSLLTIISTYPL